MPSNARPRNAQLGRQPTEILGHVADASRRYNDRLCDVRGLTSHTR